LLRHVRDGDRVAGRIDSDLPLLVLSGRATELERLRGFASGADDYMIKPFSYPELHARVGALLRRNRRRPGAGRLRIGSLELDPLSRQVWLGGDPVALSKKEFALLRALAIEPTRVFAREELLRSVWGFRSFGATRTLDSHACRLRRKLNARGARFVVNVWGVGYRLVDGGIE
jgi:DNA-binding response OmpR family regulator